jgi:predicted neuraminidase
MQSWRRAEAGDHPIFSWYGQRWRRRAHPAESPRHQVIPSCHRSSARLEEGGQGAVGNLISNFWLFRVAARSTLCWFIMVYWSSLVDFSCDDFIWLD